MEYTCYYCGTIEPMEEKWGKHGAYVVCPSCGKKQEPRIYNEINYDNLLTPPF